MPMIGKYLRQVGARAGYQIWCPACERPHYLAVYDVPGTGQAARTTTMFDPEGSMVTLETPESRYSFNDDFDAPTFEPDLLIHTGRMIDADHVPSPEDPPEVCHSDITDGAWRFRESCTHALAGQVVPLVEWEPAGAAS